MTSWLRFFVQIHLLCILSVAGVWAQSPEVAVPRFPGTREGAEFMLSYILNASREEREVLTDSLRPLPSDYSKVFTVKFGKKVYKYHRKLFRMADIVIQPLLPYQTEYLLWEASREDLLEYVSEARHFPGGYHEIADNLKPGFTYYRFKFVEPGRKLGSAYDVLVYVDGHWRIFHRPWVVRF